jgi:non-specific serine/threonine protein kinase
VSTIGVAWRSPPFLVGRQFDLRTLVIRLCQLESRLVTLSGAAGAGKTALALAASADPRLATTFPDGVTVVDLTTVATPAGVPAAIGEALGLRESTTPHAHVTDYLRQQRALLVLDNFEHVLAAGPMVVDLLAACPAVKVLATSRTPLRLRGEILVPVLPLPVPPNVHGADLHTLTRSPAVALFKRCAEAADPSLAWDVSTARAVAVLCARLDGLPLALELAAARVRHLPPAAILAQLGGPMSGWAGTDAASPGDAVLRLLTDGARDLPARHQTLRGAIAWSYDLLTGAERALLRALAVFSGTFTLAAAAAVGAGDQPQVEACGADNLGHLAALVDANLVVRLSEAGEHPDFRLLETVRTFAYAELAACGEADEVHRRHALYCLRFAEQAVPNLQGDSQATWLVRLENEHDNLRGVLAWARSASPPAAGAGGGDPAASGLQLGVRLAGALWWFWYRGSYLAEGRRWIESLLAAAPPGPALDDGLVAQVLCGAGALARRQGDYLGARAHLERALQLARRCGGVRVGAYALGFLGLTNGNEGDFAAGASYLEAAIHELRTLGDTWGVAFLQNPLARCYLRLGRAGARRELEASALTFRRLGDAWGLSLSLQGLADVALAQGRPAAARAQAAEALVLARDVRDRWMVLSALTCSGATARAEGDIDRALPLFQEALAVAREADTRGKVGDCLARIGAIATTAAEYAVAARLLGAARSQRDLLGGVTGAFDVGAFERSVTALRRAMDGDAFEAAWTHGTAMSVGQAVDLALTLELAGEPNREREPANRQGPPVPAQPPSWSPAARAAGLTPREWEVLTLLAGGGSTRTIASQLSISPHTAVRHAASILGKLGVSTRGEAVAKALGIAAAARSA